ncbi:Methylcytosine dioxygenase TET1, partial [Plecturocebus cupreus]
MQVMVRPWSKEISLIVFRPRRNSWYEWVCCPNLPVFLSVPSHIRLLPLKLLPNCLGPKALSHMDLLFWVLYRFLPLSSGHTPQSNSEKSVTSSNGCKQCRKKEGMEAKIKSGTIKVLAPCCKNGTHFTQPVPCSGKRALDRFIAHKESGEETGSLNQAEHTPYCTIPLGTLSSTNAAASAGSDILQLGEVAPLPTLSAPVREPLVNSEPPTGVTEPLMSHQPNQQPSFLTSQRPCLFLRWKVSSILKQVSLDQRSSYLMIPFHQLRRNGPTFTSITVSTYFGSKCWSGDRACSQPGSDRVCL